MHPNEARHIEAGLASLASEAMSHCLDIGPSTAHFRTGEQPHVDAHVLQPLRPSGMHIFNVDISGDVGVNLVGNVLDADFRTQLQESTLGSSWELALLHSATLHWPIANGR
jgi:hypothetical protein